MDFWKRLNALIKERKVTQEWVANQLGIKYPTFKNWSARHIIPDAIQSVAIAKALNTSVEYLVTGKEPDPVYRIPDDLLSVMRKYVN